MSPTLIPHVSGHTIVVCTLSSGNDTLELPSGAEVGDIVEIYSADANGGNVVHPAGESVAGNGGGDTSLNSPTLFRKLAPTLWGDFKSN